MEITKHNFVDTIYSFSKFNLLVSSLSNEQRSFICVDSIKLEIVNSYSVCIETAMDDDCSILEFADVTVSSLNFTFTFHMHISDIDDFVSVAPFSVEVV